MVNRATWQLALVSLFSGSLALLAGCSSEPSSHVVSAPPPPSPQTQLVVAQPQQTQVVVSGTVQTPNGTIVVMQAPPAMQQEVILAQPTSDHKWVPGFWTWRNEHYEWMAGHWELPPNSNAVWVAPRWERRSDGSYRFFEGYWN